MAGHVAGPRVSHIPTVKMPSEPSSLGAIVTFLRNQGNIDYDSSSVAAGLSAAFLRALGVDRVASAEAKRFLDQMTSDPRWGTVATFYAQGLDGIASELDQLRRDSPETLASIDALAERLSLASSDVDLQDLREGFWSAFFPEGQGIIDNEHQRRDELRKCRVVTVEAPATEPIVDPGRQVLLTTNALFTVPASGVRPSSERGEPATELEKASAEPQRYWYDHPIPIGARHLENEVVHGLQGMDEAIGFEKKRGIVESATVMPVIISASATHSGLTPLLRRHVNDLLCQAGRLQHLNSYVFTEADARRLVDETVAPAVAHFLPDRDAKLLDVIGVDGRYGRHYSFLKAIAAWWNVMVDSSVIATYKFDLDQTFPQDVLVEETSHSAMEHLSKPTWGAYGTDANGDAIELGMMAGSLVNESDIASSLFTLDVGHPSNNPTIDEMVFWSALPQALSTAAEMGARYRYLHNGEIGYAVERVHVTGGTSAIRVDALRRHRPFTPSFIARAEDQAYLFSVHEADGPRLACLHNDGLIMRHDKESFAATAIRAASIGKLIGDYERIILFSAYARGVTSNTEALKSHFDPFTGCFISRLPVTVTYLRFALRSLRFFAEGEYSNGDAFTEEGAARIGDAIRFVSGTQSSLVRQLDEERAAWELFYDALDAIEEALADGDRFVLELTEKARGLLDDIVIRAG
jgi:hypothetical protein